ncbi:HEPN domain-containing protein [Candidatus Thiodictyon syntrophicum]|uniref:HEPN domain-containing protein n=1 Tax=Candidatus Thiodictyon syntrophicum TaxID=1166950 RepID=UPI001C12B427|nr:HEPN domain-containing protein [Candidatus Thiodictyon syntrophicum]
MQPPLAGQTRYAWRTRFHQARRAHAHLTRQHATGDRRCANRIGSKPSPCTSEGRHEWACFAAQQAGEKAVKALHLSLGQESWGQVIARLLRDLPVEVPAELVDKGRVLDNFYIATRYANGHAEGAPVEHYGPLQSGDAIRYASEILGFVRAAMAEPRGG